MAWKTRVITNTIRGKGLPNFAQVELIEDEMGWNFIESVDLEENADNSKAEEYIAKRTKELDTIKKRKQDTDALLKTIVKRDNWDAVIVGSNADPRTNEVKANVLVANKTLGVSEVVEVPVVDIKAITTAVGTKLTEVANEYTIAIAPKDEATVLTEILEQKKVEATAIVDEEVITIVKEAIATDKDITKDIFVKEPIVIIEEPIVKEPIVEEEEPIVIKVR